MRSAISVLLERAAFGDVPDGHALSCHLLDGEEFLCRADHFTRKMLAKTWDLSQMWLVVYGCAVSCLGVLSMCNVQKTCCFMTNFIAEGRNFSS